MDIGIVGYYILILYFLIMKANAHKHTHTHTNTIWPIFAQYQSTENFCGQTTFSFQKQRRKKSDSDEHLAKKMRYLHKCQAFSNDFRVEWIVIINLWSSFITDWITRIKLCLNTKFSLANCGVFWVRSLYKMLYTKD